MSFKTTEDKPQIEELLLQGNIFSLAQTQEITNPQNDLALRVFLDYPYRGIEYPLRYEPTDYGVEIYNC